MKRLWIALVALLAAGSAHAQDSRHITMVRLFDADDASAVYCYSLGRSGGTTAGTPRGRDYQSTRKVKTVGSSTTVVSDTASSGALTPLDVGDLFSVVVNGVKEERVVVTNADDDTITINEAVDISGGVFYYYRDVQCSGAVGAFSVADIDNFQITVHVAQMGVTSGAVNALIECKQKFGDFLVIESAAITAGGSGTANFLTRVFADESWSECRAGVSVDEDDAADAVLEQVNIYLSGKGVVQ